MQVAILGLLILIAMLLTVLIVIAYLLKRHFMAWRDGVEALRILGTVDPCAMAERSAKAVVGELTHSGQFSIQQIDRRGNHLTGSPVRQALPTTPHGTPPGYQKVPGVKVEAVVHPASTPSQGYSDPSRATVEMDPSPAHRSRTLADYVAPQRPEDAPRVQAASAHPQNNQGHGPGHVAPVVVAAAPSYEPPPAVTTARQQSPSAPPAQGTPAAPRQDGYTDGVPGQPLHLLAHQVPDKEGGWKYAAPGGGAPATTDNEAGVAPADTGTFSAFGEQRYTPDGLAEPRRGAGPSASDPGAADPAPSTDPLPATESAIPLEPGALTDYLRQTREDSLVFGKAWQPGPAESPATETPIA